MVSEQFDSIGLWYQIWDTYLESRREMSSLDCCVILGTTHCVEPDQLNAMFCMLGHMAGRHMLDGSGHNPVIGSPKKKEIVKYELVGYRVYELSKFQLRLY